MSRQWVCSIIMFASFACAAAAEEPRYWDWQRFEAFRALSPELAHAYEQATEWHTKQPALVSA